MESVKLNDARMQQYLRDGYILLQTSLDPAFHETVYRKTHEVFLGEGNPGNNLLPRLPQVGRIFQDPVVAGALVSILGENYLMEPHRHCHPNAPGSKGQGLHKDSFTRRRHRTRRVLAFYYPQDTPEDRGPTSIVPGSQYCNTREGALAGSDEMLITGKAGTVAIVNYDIWHRGTANSSNKPRYMMKFLFARMSEPDLPAWNGGGSRWPNVPVNNRPMHASMWAWHGGAASQDEPNGSVGSLIDTVLGNSEPEAIHAVYQLGSTRSPAVSQLVELLKDDSGKTWWEHRKERAKVEGLTCPSANASYGLSAAGRAAVPALMDAATDDRWWLRATVAETLGDVGPAALASIPTLQNLARDDFACVRAEATHALGTVAQQGTAAVTTLAGGLSDEDGLVRRAASIALARTGPRAEQAVPDLVAALEDGDRYVRGNAVHALSRIDSPQARTGLIDHLMTSRWCYSTTKDSLY